MTVARGQSKLAPEIGNDQAVCLVIGCGQGRDRTADLPLFRDALQVRVGSGRFVGVKRYQAHLQFTTTIRGVDLAGRERLASLGYLYVACSLGPPRAVPEAGRLTALA
jgi:hypothetical protein